MSQLLKRGGPEQTATKLQKPVEYTPNLLDYAELLIVTMGSRVPEDGLQIGVLHQLEGKVLDGANCTSIIIFAASHAVFVDYSIGLHVTVDSAGRRTTAMLGASR